MGRSRAVAVLSPAPQSPKGPWLISPGGPTQQFWPWWRNRRFAAHVSSFFSIGNLVFLKACFSWDLFSAAGLDITLVSTSRCISNAREPVSTLSVCPMPHQARAGPRGQAAHVPPYCHARSAGNSPEPSGPQSVRGRTGREPRGTVNSSTLSPPRLRPLAPHPSLHGAHTG